jgi:glutamyl-tRNA reductase
LPSSETRADLDRIRVRYATFRDRAADERASIAAELGRIVAPERVLLDTCHRVELVSVDDGPPRETTVVGRDAVRRVFEVAAGFDSAIVAEEQILGQVREAYHAALAEGSTGTVLNALFRRALRFGRRVRAHAQPGTYRSLADPGVAWLLQRLPDPPARLLVAGTGEMAQRATVRLGRAGHRITLVSGSADRGARLLAQLSGSGHRLLVGSIGPQDVADADGLVLAVRGREPIVSAALLAPRARPWTLDFSAPAAVAHDAAMRLGDHLMTLDGLATLHGGPSPLAPGVERRLHRELEEEVERFIAWLDARRGAGALEILHGQANEVRRRHLESLRRGVRLEPEQLAAVEAASAAMFGELLHHPSIELRRGGADAATVRRLFGLDE